ATTTIALVSQIRSTIPVILVTGRRAESYSEVRESIPHDYAAFENGAVIFEYPGGQIDWPGGTAESLQTLWQFGWYLRNHGHQPQTEGRQASLRLVKNPCDVAFEDAIRKLLQPRIKLVSNGPYWDFVINEAGKENAVRYILSILNVPFLEAAVIGDDLNDLALLELSGFPM